ncbi:TPA: hypothetical protein PC537_000983 [Morganella morganii]|nr:hypothetical protein [Morganella morganii]
MAEKREMNSKGEMVVYLMCDSCPEQEMVDMHVQNTKGRCLHWCVSCGAKDYYSGEYPYIERVHE